VRNLAAQGDERELRVYRRVDLRPKRFVQLCSARVNSHYLIPTCAQVFRKLPFERVNAIANGSMRFKIWLFRKPAQLRSWKTRIAQEG
jgi:hypothetical protein